MVYIYGHNLPHIIQQQFNLQNEDRKNPMNYIPYGQIKEFVLTYNNDHLECDHLYLHEFCHDFIYSSDLKQITEQWNDDQRPESEKAEHQQRLNRIADRKYMLMTKDVNRSNQKSILLGTDSVKDYEASMSFGLSFIFSIFASSLVGYYLGIYFFQTTHDKSLILAVFFLIGALILETILYILKIQKDESISKLRKIYGSHPNMNLDKSNNQKQQKMKKDKVEQNKKKKVQTSDKLKSE